MLRTEGATDRARVRYKRGGGGKKGGRERPNEQLGRVNGWRGTIGWEEDVECGGERPT